MPRALVFKAGTELALVSFSKHKVHSRMWCLSTRGSAGCLKFYFGCDLGIFILLALQNFNESVTSVAGTGRICSVEEPARFVAVLNKHKHPLWGCPHAPPQRVAVSQKQHVLKPGSEQESMNQTEGLSGRMRDAL